MFGSERRKEQTFKTDHDNALICHDPADPEMEKAAQEYFRDFTLFVRDGLLKCGFPPCPADFMATNPMWRQPLHVWRKYCTNWISTPTSEAVLNTVTFFDFRAVYGETRLLDWLKDFTLSMAKDSKIFLGYIANLAIKNMPPIGFLKTFVVEKSGEHKDKLNMKIKGLAPLVDIISTERSFDRPVQTASGHRNFSVAAMNSATMVEWPAGRRDLYHTSTLLTNILRKNSAAEHQAIATQLHQLVSKRSQQ